MYKDPPVRDRINSFALVTYIGEPLAGFLDGLRGELVPNCFLRAHVTILPPRPLPGDPAVGWDVIRAIAGQFSPFDIELGDVDIFPISDVIYIQLAGGGEILQRMHEAMNIEGLTREEEFPYCPHVTLAQDLKSDEVDELVRVARERWAECPFPKSFRVEKISFVQSTRQNQWVELGECELGRPDSTRVSELTDLLVG